MEYVVKINWLAEEVITMPFADRSDAIAFIADIEDTLQRVANATEDDTHGVAFGLASRRQGDHTVGVQVHVGSDTIVSYQLAGV